MPKSAFSPGGADLVGKNPWQAVTAERLFGAAAGGGTSTGSGSPGTVTIVAPTGVATGGPVNGTGSGSLGTVTATAPTGVASNGTNKLFLLVIAGQSNAEGRAKDTDGVDRTTIDVDVANFYQYPGQPGQPGYQTLTSDTTPLIHYTGYTRTNSVLGPGEYQARQILADNPGSVVVAVPTAVGSTTIVTSTAAWAPSLTPGAGGSLFENMISQIVTDYPKSQIDFPGRLTQIIITLVLGESDALNGATYAAYLNALTNFVNYTIARLAAAGIPNTSGIKFVFGSMIPLLWDPTSVFADAAHIAVNRATVMASVNLPNVYFSKGVPGNNGSPTGAGGDGLHYLPATNTRTQGTSAGLVLSDTVGPTMTGANTYSNKLGHTLNFALSCDDVHATYEIVAGLDGARFSLSDPYISPAVNWAGGTAGPGSGTYSVNIRARDGSGNYGATRTYTFTVAAEVNPSSFFSSGERGGVWDWSDLSKLSQTRDGLTPVTAVGQPVAYVQSPNGNHLRAAADGSTRPTLQQVGGKYVLRFDGVDDIMYADTPFYIPGSSTAYTAIAGIKAAAQASARNIIAAASTTNTAPSLAPMQSDTTTTSLKQSGRNNSFGGGVFPSLPNILDNTARVVTSAFSAAGVQRMRDASLRPSDGSAGSSYTSTTNASLGLLVDADRMAIGGSAGATPGAYFAGDLFPMFVINRYLTDDETMFGEEWEANRSLSTALPGQVGPLDGYALGSVGTVAVSAPTGTASGGGTGSSSGNGAGSPGVVTLSSVGGNAVSSANASGSIGSVSLFPPVGSQTSVLPVTIEEPLTLEDVKDYLGIFTNDKDYALSHMIPRARLWVEDYTGLAIAKRQFVERLRPTLNGVIRLSKGPLASVDSVTYLDSSGEAASLTPSFYPPSGTLTYANGWPRLNTNEAFTVTYTAGADAEDIDDRLKGAMFALIEGEFSEGYAYPDRATQAAERCCLYLRQMVA